MPSLPQLSPPANTTTMITAHCGRSRVAFKLVVFSLFTAKTTMGLVQSSSLRHRHRALPKNPPSFSRTSSSTMTSIASSAVIKTVDAYNHATSTPSTPATKRYTTPTLSREEETELLRQVYEYRRISKLEKDLALSPKYSRGTPLLLSVKAREAGYGDEFELYEQAKFDGQKAREKLVTHNMGLVHHCVNQIVGKDRGGTAGAAQYKKLPLNSLSREDLVQEGAIGLARAVDKWDPSIAVDGSTKGNKFGTYAYYWIRAAVLRCIAERDDLMRVPSHVSQAVREINKAASRLGIDLEGGSSGMISSISWKEAQAAKKLAEEAGLTEKKFRQAMKVRSRRYSGGYVPFEQWMQRGQDLENDVTTDLSSMTITAAAASSNAEQVRSVLSKYLRPKEIEALSWRYGLLKDGDDVIIQQQQQQMAASLNESPAERANRQFAEMEDDLFGGTTAQASVLAANFAASVSSNSMILDKLNKTAASPTGTPTVAVLAAAHQPAALTQSASISTATGKSGEAMSFVDVGKRMKVSAEYTRKLCHQALDKLRSAADEGRLEPAFLM